MQHVREVLHHPGHGPDRVHGPAQGRQAETADAAVGGLQPGDAAVRRGVPDRSRGVLPQRTHAQPGGDARARAGAGAAGHVVEIPGIAGGRQAAGKTAHVELAEQHRPGLAQAPHRGAVFPRTRWLRDAHHGQGTLDVVLILHRDGNAVERPPITALLYLLLRHPGLLQGALLHEVHEGVQTTVEGLDPVEVGPGQLNWGDLALLQARRHAVNARETQIRHFGSSLFAKPPAPGFPCAGGFETRPYKWSHLPAAGIAVPPGVREYRSKEPSPRRTRTGRRRRPARRPG